MTDALCEYLIPVPNVLPGYAQLIYRPCNAPATTTRAGRPVCEEHR